MRGDVGDEHPLLVYAANGILVVDSEYPLPLGLMRTCATSECSFNRSYGPEHGYAHLRTLADSALRGLDTAASIAALDLARVGTGGVSHGSFVPLYTAQLYDRFAALSVAGGSWTPLEYYLGRLPEPHEIAGAPNSQWPKDPAFWEPIDLSQHVETIEAPILFQIPDRELVGRVHLLRNMSDSHLPYDAFLFPNELHLKWQPAHRLAVYNRNLDWFRFWLQDIEDPDSAKADQYARWRKLRELQCKNPRSLRDYCGIESKPLPIAR